MTMDARAGTTFATFIGSDSTVASLCDISHAVGSRGMSWSSLLEFPPSHQLLDHNPIISCCSTASLATPGTHPQDSIAGQETLQLANVQDALRWAPWLHTQPEPVV